MPLPHMALCLWLPSLTAGHRGGYHNLLSGDECRW